MPKVIRCGSRIPESGSQELASTVAASAGASQYIETLVAVSRPALR